MKRNQTVGYAPSQNTLKPMIRLANNFLLKYGFTIRAEIEIEYQEGIITITLKNKKLWTL